MSAHKQIQSQFYDYIQGGLKSDEHSIIDTHLASCTMCRCKLEELKRFIESPVFSPELPSDKLPPEYWNNFALEVEQKIRTYEIEKREYSLSLWDWLNSLFIFHKRQIIAVSSALTIVCMAITGWLLYVPTLVDEKIALPEISSSQFMEIDQKVGEYLHKSKTLLVGISNLDLEEKSPIDVTAEKKASRNLVQEARYLKNQPLDIRSARLIGDLERIQIELATIKDDAAIPRIEMLREGIHRGNLLFKIRMAESMYEMPRLMNVNNIYSGDRK
jgi:hypothetical protein